MKKALSILLSLILVLTMLLMIPAEAGASLTAGNLNTYKKVLRSLHNNATANGNYSVVEKFSSFAMIDIDGDKTEELITKLSDGVMAGQHSYIVNFTNKAKNTYQKTVFSYYIDGIYRGGYIKVLASHNQGPSLSVWPYTVYKYSKGKLVTVFSGSSVDQKADHSGYYSAALDEDNDGVIYYFNKTPMTKKKYIAYVNRYIPSGNKLNLKWYSLTNSNINKLSASMISTTLASPKITSMTNIASGVQLKWSRVSGAAKYRVFIKSGTWKKVADTTANTYVHKGVKSGKSYTYTVRCLAKNGKTLTGTYNSNGWTTTYIGTPALPTLKNTKNGVQIGIKKVAGAAKYRVFRKVGKSAWVKITDTTNLSVVDKTAKNGVTYTYTIRCVSKDGRSFTSAYNTKGRAIKCVR